MCEDSFWDKFLVSDHRTLKLMEDFPMHKFRSNPVAYVPMGGGTRGGLVAAVYRDGTIAALKPTLHDVTEIDAKENEDTQEQFLAAAVGVHDGELAVAIWDSTHQSYRVNLYRVEKYSFKRVGSAPLAPPRTGEILCGFAHTGDRLMCVWVDGSLQIYGPKEEGLSLLQSYKLTGFDFGVMRKRSGTEDLRSLPMGVSVCASIGTRDLVVVAGPNAEKKGLKYVVVDMRTGMVQSSGILYEKVAVEAPVKLIVVDASAGKIRGVVGGEDMGEEFVTAESSSLAGRLGINAAKPFSRKRKLTNEVKGVSPAKHIRTDRQSELVPENPSCSHRSITFSLPAWAKLICKTPHVESSTLASTPIVKRMSVDTLTASPPKKNGMLKEAMLSKSVADLMESFSSEHDPTLIDKSIQVLKECKDTNVVLTVDLVGVTAGAIADSRDSWEKLEALIDVFPLANLTRCPNLLAELVKASQFALIESVLEGVGVLGAEELKRVLHAIFESESDPAQMTRQIDHYDRLRSSALASVSGAEGRSQEELSKILPRVQQDVALVEGFSQTEILLHPLLWKSSDAVNLAEAFCDLSPGEAAKLLAYLGKWLEKHMRLLSPGCNARKMPEQKSVVDWLNALVSCQIAALSVREQDRKVAEGLLQSALKWKSFIQKSLMCKSVMELILGKEKFGEKSEEKSGEKSGEKEQGGIYRITLLDVGVKINSPQGKGKRNQKSQGKGKKIQKAQGKGKKNPKPQEQGKKNPKPQGKGKKEPEREDLVLN